MELFFILWLFILTGIIVKNKNRINQLEKRLHEHKEDLKTKEYAAKTQVHTPKPQPQTITDIKPVRPVPETPKKPWGLKNNPPQHPHPYQSPLNPQPWIFSSPGLLKTGCISPEPLFWPSRESSLSSTESKPESSRPQCGFFSLAFWAVLLFGPARS